MLKKLLAALVVCCIFLGSVPFGMAEEIVAPPALDHVPYPQDEYAPGWEEDYDAWRADQRARRQYAGAGEILADFYAATAQAFLAQHPGENAVYSPLNVYQALALLAEITDGETRGQLLSLLGANSIESLRTQAYAVLRANDRDDGLTTSLSGASLWLDESVPYNPDTLQTLADNYFASAYRGKMGSETLNRAYREWLSEKTGGFLADQVSQEKLPGQTKLCLTTALYFRARWDSTFYAKVTADEVFHSLKGDVIRPFMHRTEYDGRFIAADRFTAAVCDFSEGGCMWFLLPDEGVTPEELLADPQALALLSGGEDVPDPYWVVIHFSVPKFDVTSCMTLNGGLSALGIQDAFSETDADFSPLTDMDLYLSTVLHNARVAVDEQGVVAAAYTKMLMDATAAAPPDEEVDFILDRPFLFVLYGLDDSPLFIGIVHNP